MTRMLKSGALVIALLIAAIVLLTAPPAFPMGHVPDRSQLAAPTSNRQVPEIGLLAAPTALALVLAGVMILIDGRHHRERR